MTIATSNAWRTLAITSVVVFLVSLEITVIALAFPEIEAAFPESSTRTLSWVLTAYNIGIASFLLLAGWLADAKGRRKVFLLGLGFFAFGSFAASIAWSGPVLIGARVFQSIGGAIQYPAGLALLLEAFPIGRREFALGIWGATGALAAAAGPSLGGLLVDSFGWRSIFALNVPISLLFLVLGRRWLIESTGGAQGERVDAIGVPLASLGVGALLLAVVQAGSWGLLSAELLISVAIGLVLLGAFVVRSKTHPAPLLDLSLFSIPSFAIGNLGAIAFTIAFFSWLVTLPSYVQEVWRWSISETGFAIALTPLVSAVLSPLFGHVADRIGLRPILMLSGASGALGSLLHLWLTSDSPSLGLGILLPGLFLGISAGAGFAMLTALIMRDVPPARFGMAGAGRTTIFQLAVGVGIALGFALTVGETDGYLSRMRFVWALGAVMYCAQFIIFAFRFPRGGQVGLRE